MTGSTPPPFRSRWAEWVPSDPSSSGTCPTPEPPKLTKAPDTPLFGGFVGYPPVPILRIEGSAAHPCASGCGADAGPEAVWCPPCWQARQGRVLRFDPGRRARAVARESARPCSSCGGNVRRFTPRGDSSCVACFPPPGAKS